MEHGLRGWISGKVRGVVVDGFACDKREKIVPLQHLLACLSQGRRLLARRVLGEDGTQTVHGVVGADVENRHRGRRKIRRDVGTTAVNRVGVGEKAIGQFFGPVVVELTVFDDDRIAIRPQRLGFVRDAFDTFAEEVYRDVACLKSVKKAKALFVSAEEIRPARDTGKLSCFSGRCGGGLLAPASRDEPWNEGRGQSVACRVRSAKSLIVYPSHSRLAAMEGTVNLVRWFLDKAPDTIRREPDGKPVSWPIQYDQVVAFRGVADLEANPVIGRRLCEHRGVRDPFGAPVFFDSDLYHPVNRRPRPLGWAMWLGILLARAGESTPSSDGSRHTEAGFVRS